jgi:hypothetical protein
MTFRGRLASRLIEVGSLPDEKDRAGTMQKFPRCQAAIRRATFTQFTLLPQSLQVQPWNPI